MIRRALGWLEHHAVVFVLVGLVGLGYVTIEQRHQSHTTCTNGKTLASIERRLVVAQEVQTAALLREGVTFGISRAELPKLLTQSRRTQAQFLSDLDQLATVGCN